jgi:hypothetical protein
MLVVKNCSGQSGTYVFKFNGDCMIDEVLAYADDDEEEFLEA